MRTVAVIISSIILKFTLPKSFITEVKFDILIKFLEIVTLDCAMVVLVPTCYLHNMQKLYIKERLQHLQVSFKGELTKLLKFCYFFT